MIWRRKKHDIVSVGGSTIISKWKGVGVAILFEGQEPEDLPRSGVSVGRTLF